MDIYRFIDKYEKYDIKKTQNEIDIKFSHDDIFNKNFFNDVIDIINSIENVDNFDADTIEDDKFVFRFCICDNPINYTKEQYDRVKELKNFAETNNIECFFRQANANFTFEEVENANKQINELANKIASQNLSPLEQMLSVYIEITKKPYQDVLLTIDNYMSRSVYGVLNSNFIVCVGYSELFEAIMKQINPNIKIYENSIIVGGRHSDLIVHLIDKKYNIDGLYLLDPTFDNKGEKKENIRLGMFLLPLTDFNCVNKEIELDDYTYMVYTSNDDGTNSEKLEYKRKYETNEGNISLLANKGHVGLSTLKEFLKNNIIKNTVEDLLKTDLEINYKKLQQSFLESDSKTFEEVSKDIKYINEKIEMLKNNNIPLNRLGMYQNKIIDAITYLSAPIPFKFMKNAVKTYISKNNPQLSEYDVTIKTNEVMQLNIENAGLTYNENATNCFAQKFYSMQEKNL